MNIGPIDDATFQLTSIAMRITDYVDEDTGYGRHQASADNDDDDDELILRGMTLMKMVQIPRMMVTGLAKES